LKPEILAEPILVGRQSELQELKNSLDLAAVGKGTTLFISGEAGSGKTRLINEFLQEVRGYASVLSGWCLSNAAVPFFPFVEAFESLFANEESNSFGSQQFRIKKWLTEPNWIGTLEKQDDASLQSRKDQMFANITKELMLMSTSKPTILFIDDINWADSASLALLHYIARATGSERILVLASYRSEELSVSVEGQSHLLLETLRLMGREGIFREIKLQNLSKDDVGRIAESMLGGKLQPELVENLSAESRGNPLFIVESLRMLHERRCLFRNFGQWQLNVEKFGIPAKVKDVILRRIESLKPNQRRILDAASVIGEKFDPKLVGAVVLQDSLDVLESLDAIAQSTLLVSCEGDNYRFDHAKSREMLYDRIPTVLKKEYHSRIADKLENSAQTIKETPVSDLAYHYSEAGNKTKAIKYTLAAGKNALARFSNKEAIKHFMYILQSIDEEQNYAEERRIALEGLGEAYFACSMFKEAAMSFEKLRSFTTGVMKLRALRRAMDSAFFQGEFAHLLHLTKEAEEYTSADRLEGARILMNKARAIMFLGNYEEGRKDFESSLQVFEEELSLSDVARTSLGLGGVHSEEKQEKGLARILRAVTLFDELKDSRGLTDACNRAGQSFGYRMLTKEALDMNEKTCKIGEKIGYFNRMAEALVSSAWVLEVLDDFAGALSLSMKALEICKKTDSQLTRAMTYSNLVRLNARLGNLEQAEEYFQKLIKQSSEVLSTFAFVQFDLSKAVYFAAKHQYDEANQFFEKCKTSQVRVAPSIEIMVRLYHIWVLKKQGCDEEAKTQLETIGKMIKHFENCFQQASIYAVLMAPRKVELGKDFSIRLDIVNVSRKPCKIDFVEGLICRDFRVVIPSDRYVARKDIIEIRQDKIDPFQDVPFKLSLQAFKTGIFTLEPRVFFIDDLGKTKTFQVDPISITVEDAPPQPRIVNVSTVAPIRLEFNSETARKVFNYLVNAFVDDYKRLRKPQERSGWRTLMEIVRHSGVTKYSVYGFSGKRGQAVTELECARLVEERVFAGERGRGGKIFKLRIAYENDEVRKQI
jgi:tetratricopeptide (TPR) repeat protein